MEIEEIRKWHKVFKPNNELFEIRVLGDRTYSAYFHDIEKAIVAMQPYDKYQIYFTVNEVKAACSGRTQYDRFECVSGSATSKNDIEKRDWLPIDIDVERPSKVSASNEEKEYAHKKAASVYNFLKEANFPDPIVCDSSSGYHLYYPVEMDSSKEVETAIKDFFGVLSDHFTDSRVKVDKAVADSNRIMRLYGTWGRKGRNSKDRPHRLSKIIKIPNIEGRMSYEDLLLFIDKYGIKKNNQVKSNNNYYKNNNEKFDLRAFIEKYNIEIERETPYEGGTKFILKECPFDSSHKAPDSALFLSSDGSIGFKCLHSSCSDKDWRAFRLHYDPTAYDYEYKQYNQMQQPTIIVQPTYGGKKKEEYKVKEEDEKIGKKWFKLSDIQRVDILSMERIKTGFRELDRRILGLAMGEVTIISGSNSSGKSSWLNTLCLNVAQQGYKTALWSAELQASKLKEWVEMAAAGKKFAKPSIKKEGKFYVTEGIRDRIDLWLDDKLFIYNNDYGSKWEQAYADMNEIVEHGVKLLILDNLFSMDIESFEGDKNNKQKEFILQVTSFAKKKNVHCIVVCHPRKSTDFLRKESISGTADLTNACDNCFIIHRVNNDFKKRGAEFFGDAMISQYVNFGNVLEVAKNRMFGVVDYLCGMYYEVESRRFKNDFDEEIRYDWENIQIQKSIEGFESRKPYKEEEVEEQIDNIPFQPFSSEEVPF